MPGKILPSLIVFQMVMQRIAQLLIVAFAAGSLLMTTLAIVGYAPWLSIPVTYGETAYPDAGIYVQLGLTVLAFGLCFFLPGNARIMRLENSHRSFSIGMNDVARAYAIAHAGDRAGLFQISSEFDGVRERLAHLREHPDLAALEPSVLEVAAQMSHLSQELADTYSDERVSRAKGFLQQRQQEVVRFNQRLEHAKQVTQELKQWLTQVELEESVAASQLQRLQDELREVLPELGMETVVPSATVVEIAPKAAE